MVKEPTCFHKICENLLGFDEEKDLYRNIAEAYLNLGFKRCIVTQLSIDSKALVVVHTEGQPRIDKERLLISRNKFTQKVISTQSAIKCLIRSDERSYGKDPWAEKLKRADLFEWLELPIVYNHKIQGLIFADNGKKGAKINLSIIEKASDLTNKLGQFLNIHLTFLNKNRISKVKRELRNLDSILNEILEKVLEQHFPKLSSVYQTIADTVVSIIGADFCDISFLETDEYKVVAQSGILEGIGQEAKEHDNVTEQSISVMAMKIQKPCYFIGERTDSFFKKILDSIHNKD